MRYTKWRRVRYGVPAVIVLAVAGGALVPALSGASSPPDLPAISAQQLLTDVAQASPPELSGSLTWTANLGLSDLSSLEGELGQGGGASGDGGSGFDALSLLSGSYQINVWLDGTTAEHLALIDAPAQEVDLVRSGDQAWLWDSSVQTATHLVGDANGSGGTSNGSQPTVPLTPQQLASRFLNDVDPTTTVTTGTSVYVAGQAAYQLLLTPKSAPGSTIDHIEVDVGATGPLLGVPLQVAVYAAGQTGPAIELGFTGQIQLGIPAASELTFTPPPGAKIVTHNLGAANDQDHSGMFGRLDLKRTGSGWTTVVSGTDSELSNAAVQAELDAVTMVVEVGGQPARLFNTDLLNVLIMPDGDFYAGFVTPAVLEAAASASS
jgi:hypothetical protein